MFCSRERGGVSVVPASTNSSPAPLSSLDLYNDELITEPYEAYRALRNAGDAVWLEAQGVWAVSRYRDVHAALADYETFSSAQGVALGDLVNVMTKGGTIASDPPEHNRNRTII